MVGSSSDEMRTFIALDIQPTTLQQIGRAIALFQDEVRKGSGRISKNNSWMRWVPNANIHLTLKFLGNVSPEIITAARSMLEKELEGIGPFTLEPSGFGVFPRPSRPNVFWVGLKSSSELVRVVQAVEEGMLKLGFDREEKPFSPHLTLGRVQRDLAPRDVQALARTLQEAGEKLSVTQHFDPFIVDAIHMYRSELTPGGARYTRLYSVPLKISLSGGKP